MRVRVTLTVALAVFAAVPMAQPIADAPSVQFRYIGLDDGLPSPRVNSIAQDTRGFVWVATNDGVSRFDGVRFQTWRQGAGGLPSNVVFDIHVDRSGTLWLATEGGLARFNVGRAQFSEVAEHALDSLGVGTVRYLNSDRGGLWMSTRSGIYHLGPGDRVTVRERGALSAALLTRVGDTVWSRSCNLSVLPPCRIFWGSPEPAPRVSWVENGRTYFTSVNGEVYRMGARDTVVARWPADITSSPLSAIASPERAWLGSETGLTLYLPQQDKAVRVGAASGLRGSDIQVLYEDHQGGVWVGTELGLHRWTPPRAGFRATTPSEGLGDTRVNGLALLNGDTWIATNGGLFQHRPDGSFQRHLGGQRLKGSAVWQVIPAQGGGLWLGGKRFGLHRYWPDTGRREPVREISRLLGVEPNGSLINVPVRHLAEREGRLWVGSSFGLAVREPDGRWRGFVAGEGGRDGLSNAAVNTTYRDSQGRTWIGSDGGVDEFLVERGAFRHTGLTRDLDAPTVWHITEIDADPGVLWIATVGDGVCRYDPETDGARCLTTADGLPSNAVHRIEPGDGALWLGTDRGIARLDVVTGQVATFTEADGLHGDVIDFMSSARADDGTILMGGPGGYTSFRPQDVRPSDFQPPVRFVSVEIAGKPTRTVSAGDTLSLRRGGRRFAAEFAALDYTQPSSNRYRYRLAPLEETWTEATGAVEARYAALPPGEYVLEVMGSNYAGVFSPEVATLAVSVPPAWWERSAVQTLLMLLALASVAGLGWARTRRSDQRRAEAVEVSRRLSASREAERLRLARELHDGTMQQLYRVGHDLDRLATLVPDTERAEVSTARATLDAASDELRGVLSDIRLPQVGTFGAAAAVRAVAERFQDAQPDTHVVLSLGASGRHWPVEIQHAATRIVQEALSNVARHAQARSVRVALGETDDGQACIEVDDDGRGFDARISEVDHVRGDHFGLVGLRERAEALGGRAEVTSTPGLGTRVRAWLPLA